MILKDYIDVIKRRRWMIAVTVIVTLGIVGLGTALTVPTYGSTATMRIATAAGGSISYTDYIYNDRLVNTYIRIATSLPVLNTLKTRLGVAEAPGVRVEVIANTELINITVEDPNPLIAQQGANTLAAILIEQSKELYTGGGKDPREILAEQLTQVEQELNQERKDYEALIKKDPSDSETIAVASRSIELKQNTYATLLEQYEEARLREALRANTISIIEPAAFPKSPTRPDWLMNMGLGLVLGALAGLGLAFIFNHFDATIYTHHEIESIVGQKAIGRIPTVKEKRVHLSDQTNSPYSEAYRRLKVSTQRWAQQNSVKTIMVTSAEPGEGKSTITANLGIELARAGKKVIVIDADTNLPMIHRHFKLDNSAGLSDILTGKSGKSDPIQETGIENLTVITSGDPLEDASEKLRSKELTDMLIRLKKKADYILLDTPAILEVADAVALTSEVDGIALIVRQGATSAGSIQEASEVLNSLKPDAVKLIINHADLDHRGSYYFQHRDQEPSH